MYKRLVALVVGLCLVAPGGTLAEPPPGNAALEFTGLYQRWTHSRDPEEIIGLGEQALALEQGLASWHLDVPRQSVRGELRFGLGSAYVARAGGVRADNIERAIVHLESALGIFTRDADPLNWASTHNNLGSAFTSRIDGERSDNQDKAIAHFESALTVLTREDYPQQWAQLQNNLALAYNARISGDRAANIESSIEHLNAALTVFTRDTFRPFWAAAQNNLASAYLSRVRGDRGENREAAIRHLEAALTAFTRQSTPREWAQASNNLANAYLDRMRGEPEDNRDAAIAHFSSALSVLTSDAHPHDWAMTQRGLARAYSERTSGESALNRAKAVAALESALSIFTRQSAPLQHLRTARQLGHLLAQAGEWRRAGPYYGSAREAFLVLFGEGVEEVDARALIADAGTLFAEAAFTAAARGETAMALQLASEGRARMLAVAMRLQSLRLSGEERQRLDALRAAIRAGQQTVDAARGEERAAVLDRLAADRQALLRLLEGGARDKSGAGSVLAEARARIGEEAVIAMPIVTDLGAKIVLAAGRAQDEAPTVVDLPDLTTLRLSQVLIGPHDGPPAGWIGAYFINYLDGEEQDRRWPEWTAAIDKLGEELWQLLGARLEAALRSQGVKPGTRVVWLPSGWLAVLPLGLSQDPASKRRLGTDYEIVYAPSLETLATAPPEAGEGRPASLAAVVNPTGDLPGADTEGAIVASHFAAEARTLLEGSAATPEAVLTALAGRSHWHFASHGTFSWADPLQSGLVLAGMTRLSVERLLEAGGLGRPRLVVLSACETGLSEITRNPDEFIGLPGAFSALGATGVVGTLWPVSDEATTLLIAKFYELHMEAGLSPPAALRSAQAWLREATGPELDAYAKLAAARNRLDGRQLAAIETALTPERLARSRNRALIEWSVRSEAAPGAATSTTEEPLMRPYAHPYFWGGFIYTGH